MAVKTPVFIVCSPLQGVGKTLIARLLAEFFISEGRYAACFDLNADQPALVDYLPDWTTVSELTETIGQMRLFDSLIRGDSVPKIVDLGHGIFDQFFTIAAKVGLADEALRRQVQVVVLFVASSSPVAAQAYGTLARWLPGLVMVPVHNELLGRAPGRQHYPPPAGASLPLRIPLLAAGLRRIANEPGFSFAELRDGKYRDLQEPYRSDLESWVRQIFVEFRELELRLLLATLRLSLQL